MYRLELPQRRCAYSMIVVCIHKLMTITMLHHAWGAMMMDISQVPTSVTNLAGPPLVPITPCLRYRHSVWVFRYRHSVWVFRYRHSVWVLNATRQAFFSSFFFLVFLNKISCPALWDVCAKKKFPSPFFFPRFTKKNRYARLL